MYKIIQLRNKQFNSTVFYSRTNKIFLNYIQNDIIYIKNQYQLLFSDKQLLFPVLCRKLCRCYKKQLHSIYIFRRLRKCRIKNQLNELIISIKGVLLIERCTNFNIIVRVFLKVVYDLQLGYG